jgi:hypothetical protein
MTPLLIGLASVVVVILIAVAVGMRHVRNEERADLDDLPGGRGAANGRHDPNWASDRRRPRPDRQPARPADSARSRGAGEWSARRADRGSADAGRGYGERDDEPDFRTAQRQEARSQPRGRQVRGRRDDVGDWPSTEWDKLSDADYWKEVASDRPLVTTARAAQPGQDPPPAGPARDIGAARRPAQAAPRPAEPRHDADRPTVAVGLPVRGVPQPAAAGSGRDFLAAPAVGHGQDLRGQRPGIGPADDDPLTSPSFPKITSDSRSYHGRPAAPAANSADPAMYGAPSAQPASYGTGGARPANGRGLNGHGGTNGYGSANTGHGANGSSGANGRGGASGYAGPDNGYGSANGRRGNNGYGANGYGTSHADSSSATTAPRSYRPDAGPAAGSYGTPSLPPGARPSGPAAGVPAGQPQPVRPPAASQPATESPAGNPYGSYVTSDLPGYQGQPAAAYQIGHPGGGYAGDPAGQGNGHGGSHYLPGPPPGASAPPLGSGAAGWYPGIPAAMPSAPVPGGLPGQAGSGGQLSPSGYAAMPNGAGRHDPAGYQPAGYDSGAGAPGRPPAGRHSAGPDAARYLPPEGYRQDGYGRG